MTPEVRADDISNHPVCQSCRGICCVRFQILVGLTPDGTPDWDRNARVCNVPDVERDFIKQHFVPIKPPGGFTEIAGRASDGVELRQMWFTCLAFKDGKCSKYEQRPRVCSTHLCEPAERYGLNPELFIETGWEPGKAYRYAQLFPGLYDLNRGVPPELGTELGPVDAVGYSAASAKLREAIDAELETRVVAAMERAGISGGIPDLLKLIKERGDAYHKARMTKWLPIAVEAATEPNAQEVR